MSGFSNKIGGGILGYLTRYLSVLVAAGIVVGVILAYAFPNIKSFWEYFTYDGVNIPLAAMLIIMLFPSFAKVDYSQMGRVFRDRKALALSIIFNWVFGPILMFALAMLTLQSLPHYLTGLILIGLARCIALVITWTELGHGDAEFTTGVVAVNSVLTIILYPIYTYIFLGILAPMFGFHALSVQADMMSVATNVFVYTGIPFILAIIVRYTLIGAKGIEWYDSKFVPKALLGIFIGLFVMIVIMFSMQGKAIAADPLTLVHVAIPLFLYFIIIFTVAFIVSKNAGYNYEMTSAFAMTSASNNFELALAAAVATFGIYSPEAVTATIGPLIEIPTILLLLKISSVIRHRYIDTPWVTRKSELLTS
ncbi:ACR3 family arsenite efflux transporter [Dongshaea marina]|uniref:ACR3 family arsenite efflux transporter n=1 Tax=Dongshaea marina TaxID=2047966 RepID=UPI000D3E72A5|nr:ACR3 family arsenite efflux transporter [Dongshaea marina]